MFGCSFQVICIYCTKHTDTVHTITIDYQRPILYSNCVTLKSSWVNTKPVQNTSILINYKTCRFVLSHLLICNFQMIQNFLYLMQLPYHSELPVLYSNVMHMTYYIRDLPVSLSLLVTVSCALALQVQWLQCREWNSTNATNIYDMWWLSTVLQATSHPEYPHMITFRGRSRIWI